MNYLHDQYTTVVDAVKHSPDTSFETTVWARSHLDADKLEKMLGDALEDRAMVDVVSDDGQWGVWVRATA
jgi:hypothetical protein